MVLSRPQLTYLYFLENSLTYLQNYRSAAFVNLQLTPLKCQKVKLQQQNKERNHRKSIIDIFIGYLTAWVRFKAPDPFGPQK